MKRGIFYIFICIVVSLPAYSQSISTYAGGGTGGDGIPATISALADPGGCVFDKNGNLYVASGTSNKIRKIDTAGIISTIAGTGSSGYFGDGGQATAAHLRQPTDIIIDTMGNLIFSDCLNNVIRKINISTGIITTIAGTGTHGYSGDSGQATLAKLYSPNGICFDKYENLYIADLENNVIRKVNTIGIITTFAGNGTYGFSGDYGPATNAQLYTPADIAADDIGNIYITDGTSRIRKVNPSGIISTFAGNGTGTFLGDGMIATAAQITPVWIKIDSSNNFYISSTGAGNIRVYKIDTNDVIHLVAGNGIETFGGDGGPATNASIANPSGLAFDHCGNLYIGDINNNRVRKVTFDTSCHYIPTNTKELENNGNEINIYPNPTKSLLSIQNNNNILSIVITNLLGQTVFYKTGIEEEKAEIDLEYLPTGLYLVAVVDERGVKIVRKLVKE